MMVASIFKIAVLIDLGGGSFVIPILIAFDRLWSNTMISLFLFISCCFYSMIKRRQTCIIVDQTIHREDNKKILHFSSFILTLQIVKLINNEHIVHWVWLSNMYNHWNSMILTPKCKSNICTSTGNGNANVSILSTNQPTQEISCIY